MGRTKTIAIVLGCLLILLAGNEACAEIIVRWNFSRGLQGWTGNHFVEDLTYSRDGLSFLSTGVDPWIEGPAVDLPADRITKVTVRMRSDADRSGELFYGPSFRAGRSVRFTVNSDDQWHEYTLIITESLGARTRFRLDPATTAGNIRVSFIEVQTLTVYDDPPYQTPGRPDQASGRAQQVSSTSLTLRYFGAGIGDFVVEVAGQEMATAYDKELIGVLFDEEVQWLDLSMAQVEAEPDGDGLDLRARLTDQQGATWQVERKLRPEVNGGAIVMDVHIEVSADRDVVALPWLTLFPGLGTFGTGKDQGLLAGLEYLADEPSSSQADIVTSDHLRRAPKPAKVTFPVMAIAAEGRYVGLIWEPSEWIGPMFDSPDRVFNSGAHVVGLTGPAVGESRFENGLVAHTPVRLAADTPVTARIWIIGGQGTTVVPAVQHYLRLRDLPSTPVFEGGFQAAARLFADGWLYSKIREGGLFRHAVWGNSFAAGPAPDAAAFMDWLAGSLEDAEADLIDELAMTRDLALLNTPESRHLDGGVSHVRTPAAPLVFGDLPGYVERRYEAALSAAARFDERGAKIYQPGNTDYGATHFADHANGYGAGELVTVLEGAALSANAELLETALDLLGKQTALYAETVPRGAQTWEIPLHTPDILASGLLVKAYTLGYVLSGREAYLQQARYWAWTGVPFVYLVSPTPGQIGPYATIPVLGATGWQGSWFGRPVQWCGLVYASALHRLSRYDAEGPWRQIAQGITAAGLQMTWPLDDTDRQGLLPDYFLFEAQYRDGPAINPGTTQASLAELFDVGTLYDIARLPAGAAFIHAPCEISGVSEEDGVVSFSVEGWAVRPEERPYHVMISGWTGPAPWVTACEPGATLESARVNVTVSTASVPGSKLLILGLNGPAQVTVVPRTYAPVRMR
ncbi:MAG: hypothetical protein JSW27_19320 [Phycisphaerales bacterium]|nr:MAG: hypothetical protein JSW27_19320 [Phycisphaerales bacterium]